MYVLLNPPPLSLLAAAECFRFLSELGPELGGLMLVLVLRGWWRDKRVVGPVTFVWAMGPPQLSDIEYSMPAADAQHFVLDDLLDSQLQPVSFRSRLRTFVCIRQPNSTDWDQNETEQCPDNAGLTVRCAAHQTNCVSYSNFIPFHAPSHFEAFHVRSHSASPKVPLFGRCEQGERDIGDRSLGRLRIRVLLWGRSWGTLDTTRLKGHGAGEVESVVYWIAHGWPFRELLVLSGRAIRGVELLVGLVPIHRMCFVEVCAG